MILPGRVALQLIDIRQRGLGLFMAHQLLSNFKTRSSLERVGYSPFCCLTAEDYPEIGGLNFYFVIIQARFATELLASVPAHATP